MIRNNEGVFWFTDKEAISPIEKDLIEMSDHSARFLDFGIRTIVNYPMVSLLVRNLPLENMDLYGRIKDLLPIFLSAVNVKLSTIEMQEALNLQNSNMLSSFKNIRCHLFNMGHSIVNNREKSRDITDSLDPRFT
jgi:hypothetical protein